MRVSAMTQDSCGLDEYSARQVRAHNGFALQHSSNVTRTRGPHPQGPVSIRNSLRVAVVIRARCSSFRRASFDTATYSLLGGQHGEESEEGKDREEEEESQEEVVLLSLNDADAIDRNVESSVAKAGEAPALLCS